MMKDVKMFGELNREEKLELFNHWIEDGKIEVKLHPNSAWRSSKHFGWWNNLFYRKAQTKPSINWDHVSDDFNWLAVNSFGNGYLFAKNHKFSQKNGVSHM